MTTFRLYAPTPTGLARLMAARDTATHRCVCLSPGWHPRGYAAECLMQRIGE